MATLDKRITIYTKEGSPKFGARALVLDLNRGVNHLYNTAVAKHPIEGAAAPTSDHSYLTNIKISVSGHVSNAVAVVTSDETDSYQPYAPDREDTAQSEVTQDTLDDQTGDDEILSDIEADIPLTSEQADVLNSNTPSSENPTFVEGDTVNEAEKGVAESFSSSVLSSLESGFDFIVDLFSDKKEVLDEKDLRVVYSTDSLRKQLDAFELLEGIYHGRILLDLLTNYRLY